MEMPERKLLRKVYIFFSKSKTMHAKQQKRKSNFADTGGAFTTQSNI